MSRLGFNKPSDATEREGDPTCAKSGWPFQFKVYQISTVKDLCKKVATP